MNDTQGRARVIVLSAVVGTAVLYLVPYGRTIAYPLMLLSTFAHEMGHGVAALLGGGNFTSFHLYADGSGVAFTAIEDGRFLRAWVSAGGLVGPAVVSSICFVLATTPRRARWGLLILSTFMALSLVFVVRNLFGFAFIAVVAVLCGFVAQRARLWVGQALLAFFAVQLALSVFSRGDYLFTDVAQTATGPSPSDVAQMANALFLPYWFWGLLCGVVSLAVLGIGLMAFWQATAVKVGNYG